MRPITAKIQSPAKAALALAVSAALAASLALAAPATAQAKTVKAPAKVKKPTVSKVKATSFKITWKKAKRAKGYQVKVLKGSKTVKAITVKKKSCYATGLSSKTTYKVKVRAYNQSGKKVKYGKWSAARSVTTTKSVADAKADSYAWMHGGSSSKTHTHSWSTDSCVSGSTRIYYCLQCGQYFENKTDLESHANDTEHLQETTEWNKDSKQYVIYIYEDGKRVVRNASKQGDYAYSYVTFKNTKLLSAVEHCSCGATRTHTHTWKQKYVVSKSTYLNSRYECKFCGWKGGWNGEEDPTDHYQSGGCIRGISLNSYYGYAIDLGLTSGTCPKSWSHYMVCQDCGLCKLN